jgi:hypothetical protein
MSAAMTGDFTLPYWLSDRSRTSERFRLGRPFARFRADPRVSVGKVVLLKVEYELKPHYKAEYY